MTRSKWVWRAVSRCTTGSRTSRERAGTCIGGYSETYSRDEVPEAYLRTLVEEQATFYRDLFQVATAEQLTLTL